jgi:hypothetical protein
MRFEYSLYYKVEVLLRDAKIEVSVEASILIEPSSGGYSDLVYAVQTTLFYSEH